MKKAFFLFLLFFCIGITSCKKQLPQLPSNKAIEKDENKASLLIINQDLALREDSILTVFAQKKGNFKKNEMGFWYNITKSGKGILIKDSVQCSFNLEIKNLDAQFLQSGNKQVIIGKRQVFVGLEEGLKMMRLGDRATFIIPWYLGYGMNGDKNHIPPYTSLVCEIMELY